MRMLAKSLITVFVLGLGQILAPLVGISAVPRFPSPPSDQKLLLHLCNGCPGRARSVSRLATDEQPGNPQLADWIIFAAFAAAIMAASIRRTFRPRAELRRDNEPEPSPELDKPAPVAEKGAMPSLFLSLLAVALVTLAGREAVRVARLAQSLAQSRVLLVACWLSVATGLGLAAWLGAGIAARLHPDAKTMLVAFALCLAGLELLWQRAPRQPDEPTRSFGAIALVLTAGQLTGSGGLLVMALAGSAGVPLLAAAGGVAGAGAVLTGAWAMAEDWDRLPLTTLRYGVPALLLLAALALGLSARGIL